MGNEDISFIYFQIMKLTQKKLAPALVGNPTGYKIRHNLYNSEVWNCSGNQAINPPTQLGALGLLPNPAGFMTPVKAGKEMKGSAGNRQFCAL